MYAVAFHEYVTPHLGIPSALLMAEMHSGLKHILHGRDIHRILSFRLTSDRLERVNPIWDTGPSSTGRVC